MTSFFCAGCRAETHTDFLRADKDFYYWCEACRPALFQNATSRATGAATPRKRRGGTNA